MSDIDAADAARIRDLVARAGLPVAPPAIGAAKFRQAMTLDKKVQRKNLRFVLLPELGDAVVTSEYSESKLEQLLATAA